MDQKNEILRLRNNGMTLREISETIPCTIDEIIEVLALREEYIPPPPPPGKYKKHIYQKQAQMASCAICDETRCLEVCHLVPHCEGGSLHPINIIFLCPTHHRCMDRRMLTKEEMALIRDRLEAAIEYWANSI